VPLVVIKSGSSLSASGPSRGHGHGKAATHDASAPSRPAGYFPAWQLAADTIKSSAAADAGVGQPVAPTSTTAATTPTTSAPTSTYYSPPTTQGPTTTTTPAPVQAATAAPAPAPAPAPAAPPANSMTGIVTYYDATPGTCASPFLPFGTVVTITDPDNGNTVSCTVDDYEADTSRQIDLATATFAQLAPLSQGVISDAELSW
jgi:rare lipoprotein A (peptidoglycan hydrolase)